MSRAKLLAQRRALLIAECALQRITLVSQTRSLAYMPGWLKTSSNLVANLKNLPGWVSVALIGLVVFIPGRAVALAKNGVVLWQIWRTVFSKSAN